MPFDLTLLPALWIAFVAFGAAFVRGYSGFGFAALLISGAGLVTDPFAFTTIAVLADMAMTLGQLPGIWRHIAWRRIAAMLAGAAFGVPLGTWALTGLGVDTGRAVISLIILAMCGLLLAGVQLRRDPGAPAHAGAGFASGLANGVALGGLPIAAFFAAQPIAAAAFRATLIAYFTLLDIWTLPFYIAAGRLTEEHLLATAIYLPPMALGLWVGSRRFHGTAPASFRRFAIWLLAGLALLGLVRSVI
ncbi:sulfite exporter TauE/SafE family protein [Pseudoroseicyclus sp. CXY001]|uniref:sulfite exporter TauE/SafE family protein n=1 Tax=Pseudoroseicyclus sp. CXY001 TaxID=3242492 RepID=UPI003571580A